MKNDAVYHMVNAEGEVAGFRLPVVLIREDSRRPVPLYLLEVAEGADFFAWCGRGWWPLGRKKEVPQ